MVKLFAHLRATRTFRRQHLRFLETREDHDIAQEIGFHEESGEPLTVKKLQILGLASLPTLQRRLRRLREVGAIVARRSARDAREVELALSPGLRRTYVRYGKLLLTMRAGQGEQPAAGEDAAGS